MSINAPSFLTDASHAHPACGGSVSVPYVNESPGWITFEKPPLGMGAWKFQVVPNGYTLSEENPIQIRLLQAPLPDGIQGQKLLWNGDWLTFSGLPSLFEDVSGAGDVLFLPMAPSRDYTVQARQLGAGELPGALVAYSDIVECTVSVGYDSTLTAIDMSKVRYRVGT